MLARSILRHRYSSASTSLLSSGRRSAATVGGSTCAMKSSGATIMTGTTSTAYSGITPSHPSVVFTTQRRAYCAAAEYASKPAVPSMMIVDKTGAKRDPEDPEVNMPTFEELPRFLSQSLPDYLMPALAQNNFKIPTIIQKHAIPLLTTGSDIIALAPTGTGKTLAFAIPSLAQIDVRRQQPQVVVLCPTRELVQQTAAVYQKLIGGANPRVNIGMAFGGSPRHQQASTVPRCHVLIATPGRLGDFLDSRTVGFDGVKFVIMDEADRLLDMGFAPQIDNIMSYLPQDTHVQTMMFSATWDNNVQNLAERYIGEEYYIVSTGAHATGASVNENITQNFKFIDSPYDRERHFLSLYENNIIQEDHKVLAFVERKMSAVDYARTLRQKLKNFFPQMTYEYIDTIHGDKEQSERDVAIRNFRQGRTNLLIATDVVSRGIDVPNVSHVVNLEMPKNFDSYVHRIGRTGRAGNKGHSHSFMDPRTDSQVAKDLAEYLERCKQAVPNQLHSMAEDYAQIQREKAMGRRGFGGGRGGGRGRGGGGRGGGGGYRGGGGGGGGNPRGRGYNTRGDDYGNQW
eukprot:PhM_4_TR13665/c2_g3_i1/m.70804